MTFSMKNRLGFSLLEALLSLSVIGILAGIGIPVFLSFQTRNDLNIASHVFVNSLRRAQVLSQGVDGDTTWGARIQPGSVTVFKGASYVTRDVNFDEFFDISPQLAMGGIQEVVFSKFSGLPLSVGTTTLTTADNDMRTITINEKGVFTY